MVHRTLPHVVFDYPSSIYGKMKVTLIEWIRSKKCFENVSTSKTKIRIQ